MTVISRTTTGAPSRASPGSASKTVVTKTVTVTPGRVAPHQAETRVQAAPRAPYAESRPAAQSKPATATAAPAHHASKPAAAKPGRPAAHAESDTASRTTTNHEAIRKWAEKRGGHPTSVTGTEHGKETAGVLRLDFGVKDEKLHPVDWAAFFDKFEESNLAFLYQDRTSNGKISRFHKFIHRH
jgi:hypothetical protein